MTRIFSKLTSSTVLAEDLSSIVCKITGLSLRKVKNRLQNARGNTLVRNVFASDWPVDGTHLGGLTVAFARTLGLHEEIAAAAELSERVTIRRLNEESGNKRLANAFPEMMAGEEHSADSDEGEDGDEDEDEGDDDFGKNSGGHEDDDYAGAKKRGGDETELEEKGDVDLRQRRVMSVRADEHAVQQLVTILGISESTIRRHLEGANGHQLIGNLFARRWRAWEPRGSSTRSFEGVGTRTTIVNGLVAKRWRILRKLGEGGFGTAYEVRDELFSIPGLSVLKFAKGTQSVERLRQEIGLAFELHHQNVCAYRHIDQDERLGTFVVLQHGGVSLEKLIEKYGVFELDHALEVIRQAAAGIDYAHDRNILHQDIKPGNILVNQRDRRRLDVRISDFGISLRGRETEAVGGGRTMVATMAFGFSRFFASPEQTSGKQVSRKSDQYSLALVFCAMLEGEVFGSPYPRRTFSRLSSKQNKALERALRREPSERFPSCCDLASALGAL